MKRDMELIRQILLTMESDPPRDSKGWINIQIEGHSEDETQEHIRLLDEAGLIETFDTSSLSVSALHPERITSQGHDFIQLAKDERVWAKTMRKLGEVASTLPIEGIALTESAKSWMFGG